jgi:fission process protein 1
MLNSTHHKNHVDTTDTVFRDFGYFSSFAKSIRYAAYTSDIGEAFRPLVNVWAVRTTYAISWGYVVGDVVYEGYNNKKEGMEGQELWKNIIKRATFQSFASMIFPMITIHETVKWSKRLVYKPYFPRYLKWGPTLTGLCVIPFLPYMYDHPTEHVCDVFFDNVWPIKK